MILPILILLVVDFYAFQAIKTVLASDPAVKNVVSIIFWATSIILYVSAILIMLRGFNVPTLAIRLIFGILICISIAKLATILFLLADDGIRLTKWVTHFFNKHENQEAVKSSISRSQFISKLGLLAGGSTLGVFVWGMVRTAYNYKIRKVSVSLPQLSKQFKGLKVVQISDLHLGSFINTNAIEKAVNIINDLQPDVVFFTGDMVNEHAQEAEAFIPVLSKLKPKYGVYSTLGNHDYYGTETDLARIKAIHGECGWNILNNANRVLEIDNQKIAIIGVENWGESHYFPKKGNVDIACEGCENVDAKLLLSHDPSHWEYIVSQKHKDIDVTFSGHTHGFQMGIEISKLNFKWSPSQYAYKQWAGLYTKEKQHLYVNRGLGFIGFHGRVGILPEITLMEITGLA